MAEVRINAQLITRNDTAERWIAANPVLIKGEIALENDTGKLKFGDGVKRWNELQYLHLSISEISGLGTAAAADTGTAFGNVPILDNDGKLNTAVIPAVAITDTFVVANEAEMLALNAQKGDIAIRSDLNCTYILQKEPSTTKENWLVMNTPTAGVSSVNGLTGAVTLNTDKVAEGSTFKYYTEERATSNFEGNIAQTSITALSDGESVLRSTDTLILNGGNAGG